MNRLAIRLAAGSLATILHGAAMGALVLPWSDQPEISASQASVIAISLSSEGDAEATNEESAPKSAESAQSTAVEESVLGAKEAAIAAEDSKQQQEKVVDPSAIAMEEARQLTDAEKLQASQKEEQTEKPKLVQDEVKLQNTMTAQKSDYAAVEGADIQRQAQAASAAGLASAQNGEGKAKASGGAAATAPYARIVAAELGRHKQFPPEAKETGAAGTVAITFTIGEAGRIITHAIVKSSGYPALDRAAEMMVAAARFPPPPGGSFTASVPVRFERR